MKNLLDFKNGDTVSEEEFECLNKEITNLFVKNIVDYAVYSGPRTTPTGKIIITKCSLMEIPITQKKLN